MIQPAYSVIRQCIGIDIAKDAFVASYAINV